MKLGPIKATQQLLLVLVIIVMVIVEIFVVTTRWVSIFTNEIVGILRLSSTITYSILWVVWPILGGILGVLLFPRLLTPLFLKAKSGIWKSYQNFCLPSRKPRLTLRRFSLRMIYHGLLVAGIVSVLSTTIDPRPLVAESLWASGVDEIIALILFASLAGIVIPISTGLWSISWSLQDASLMHYKFPEDESPDLFEIEPVYLKYESLLKGYAGLSAILFVVSLSLSISSTGQYEAALLVFYIVMHTCLMAIPAILIQFRLDSTWLQKDIPTAEELKETDIRLNHSSTSVSSDDDNSEIHKFPLGE